MDSPGQTHRQAAVRPFVGREREMSVLRGALEDALGGRGRLVLVIGEPGIGKSRTAEEIAAVAERRGAEVLIGRCYEDEGAPALWPWVQILKGYVRGRDDAQLGGVLGAEAREVAQLVPEIRTSAAAGPAPASQNPEAARFRLFDAIVTLLGRAARTRPMVLVLEDLQGADQPSLLLLRFLARGLRDVPLLMVGTFRDVALTRGHPLADLLAEVLREASCERLSLRGLSESEVARFIEETAGLIPPRALSARISDRTEGHPLFLAEVVRLLLDTGQLERAVGGESVEIVIPDGVRAAIVRRLGRLSDECIDVLRLASGFGREFRADAVARASGLGPERLADALAEALADRIVGTLPGRADRYRFAHALTRDALYEEISPPRRADLHRQLGVALEAVTAAEAEPPLAELAHHFGQAGAAESERAIAYARRAGDRAMAVLAYEEAARLYEIALRAGERTEPADDGRRCELLLVLGKAVDCLGDRKGARQHFERAVDLARNLEMPEQFAQAALGLGGVRLGGTQLGSSDRAVARVLEEALNQLGEANARLRIKLLGRLAAELTSSDARDRAAALSREAVEAARQLKDFGTLAAALEAQLMVTWGPNAGERLTIATEMIRLGEECDDREITFAGRAYRIVALVELGEMDRVDVEIEALARMATKNRMPFWVYHVVIFRTMRAILDGRFAEADELAFEGLKLSRQVHDPNRFQVSGSQLSFIALMLGRTDGLVETMAGIIEQQRSKVPIYRCTLGWFYAQLGKREKARAELERVASNDFKDFRRNVLWLMSIAFAAEISSTVGDARRAKVLYELLLPYSGRNVVPGYAPVCWGPVSRYLGLLAATLELWEEAARHFEDAVTMNARMGARPWLAQTQHDYAAMLLKREAAGDHTKASSLLGAALEAAETLGMTLLVKKSRALRETAERRYSGAVDAQPDPAFAGDASVPERPVTGYMNTETARRRNVFRCEGEYWTIAYSDAVIRVHDTKGLHYIAHLLAHAGRDIHVADLVTLGVAADDGAGSHPERRAVGKGLGAVLDPQAVAAYRQRVADLREDLEEARAAGDLGRAERARHEIEVITHELSAAYGLGGRARQAGDPADRVRKAVTNQIRRAVARIGNDHPSLGRHLTNALRTGLLCAYLPEQLIDWLL
jgi:tetratricopeptide (TPR) repeat protein